METKIIVKTENEEQRQKEMSMIRDLFTVSCEEAYCVRYQAQRMNNENSRN